MTEKELKERYLSEIEMFRIWGDIVNNSIQEGLISKYKIMDINNFLKIAPIPRVKDVNSLIRKAFYIGKKYKNAYVDITDKVGVRFIVLLINEIELVKNIVEENSLWSFSKDVDFEDEKRNKPLTFNYQSVHYIVRCKKNFLVKEKSVIIPKGTPCEIQIRTLLQHAYCELSHKYIYKSNSEIPPVVTRSLAKSVAFIETTDNIFDNVSDKLMEQNREIINYFNGLSHIFAEIIDKPSEVKFNYYILESCKDVLQGVDVNEIRRFVKTHEQIERIISSKQEDKLIYKQPVILLIYFLIKTRSRKLRQCWPLTFDELKPLYTDMGKRFR